MEEEDFEKMMNHRPVKMTINTSGDNEAKSVVEYKEVDRHLSRFESSYKDTHPETVFEIAEQMNNGAISMAAIARGLGCTATSVMRWRKKYKDFDDAVRMVLSDAEAKWRDKLNEYAFQPQAIVNNGLIKMLSYSMFGISDKEGTNINVDNSIQNNFNGSLEDELKKRGIPVPKMDLEDMEEDTE